MAICEAIVEDCFAEKKYETALKAIDMLNKMNKIYNDGAKAQVLTRDAIINIQFE